MSDPRIELSERGRSDVQSGQIDRRVLATLAYLAESDLKPPVTSLKCGHSFYTSSGNVSHHSSGNAVDIAKINGIPILGHQEAGGITEQTVKQLLRLQGTMRPDQIISLLEIGGPTFAMADHADLVRIRPGSRSRPTHWRWAQDIEGEYGVITRREELAGVRSIGQESSSWRVGLPR